MPLFPFRRLMAFVFHDPVRPLELVYLAALCGWSALMIAKPELLALDNFSSLRVLPSKLWAVVMGAIAIVQIAAMFRQEAPAATMRFVAMSLCSGIWTLVAVGFWTSQLISFGAPIYTAFAVLSALSGIWLGWTRQQLRT